ncbi:MAG: tetratricopeptide repeat protein [Anaerolineae bacterium]|nr:tetratricopeptide repeat protein [Anaerolineae bacterium]
MNTRAEPNIFVAREHELAQLDAFLSRALGGQGVICFIAGDAGAGKTTLALEFARRAQEQHADLVVAVGTCDPHTGISDPFLPFRELLLMLTGQVAEEAQAMTTTENTRRLKEMLHMSGELLLQYGPDLLNTFIPGSKLLTHIGVSAIEKMGLLDKLKTPAKQAQITIDRDQIFEQYVNVLNGLANKFPLLLILDDFQWADTSSIALLFHMMRRIGNSRILIVGAFRPSDVAMLRDTQRHPLEKVLSELKRYYGDILIDLEQARQERGEIFINAFLDTKPNMLGSDFRRELHSRTGAYPLFVAELLRALQERGGIVQNEHGQWVTGDALDWDSLPGRVEGIIEERIERLDAMLRKVLEFASIQGEIFTAEIVAQLQNITARDMIRVLVDLEKRHHLINTLGQRRVNIHRLSQFLFQNKLFQQYIYERIDSSERNYLHQDVGLELEQLYGTQADIIAGQLAWHFEEAGLTDKACHYLRIAGEQALARAAHTEAANYISRALALTPEAEHAARYDMLLIREKAYELQAVRPAQSQDLAELESLAQALGDMQKQAEVALRQAAFAEATSDYPAAIAAAQRAIDWADAAQDIARQATGHLRWALTLQVQGDYMASHQHLEQAMTLAQQAGRADLEADCLHNIGILCWRLGERPKAKNYFEQALRARRKLGDRRGESATLHTLGIIAHNEGHYAGALNLYQQAVQIRREIGERRTEISTLNNLGVLQAMLGNYTEARAHYQKCLHIGRAMGDQATELRALINLSEAACQLGDLEPAREHGQHATELAEAIGNRSLHATALTNLGHALTGLQQWAEATAAYQQAMTLRSELGEQHMAIESRAGLARVALLQDNVPQAQEHVAAILAYLDGGGSVDGMENPFQVYLICYQVLQASSEARASQILEQAFNQLQARTHKINPDSRRPFLENVPAHRKLVQTYAQVKGLASTTIVESLAPSSKPEVVVPPPQPTLEPAEAIPPQTEPTASASSTLAAEPKPGLQRTLASSLHRLKSPRGLATAASLVLVVGLLYTFWSGWLKWPGVFSTPSPTTVPPHMVGLPISNTYTLDLSATNLANVNLTGVDLTGINLTAADLSGTQLNRAVLIRTNLQGADLIEADLRGALLLETDLQSADLRGANLSGANLLGANLRGADLRGADLRMAQLITGPLLLDQANYSQPAIRAFPPDLWDTLVLSDTIFTDSLYDGTTRWPLGFTPPLEAILQEK